jgi:septum formation protein
MLVLASSSPRRRDLLSNAGIPFTVRVAPVDESCVEGEEPVEYVRRIAQSKAAAAAAEPHEIVLGADTTVVAGGAILGKPENDADASRMLRLLSGQRHEVLTGICLKRGTETVVDHAVTAVWFAPMSTDEIAAYVATGEPADKAGAYAIQGIASRYINRIEGCYFNVVGLPVSLVYRHYAALTSRAGGR